MPQSEFDHLKNTGETDDAPKVYLGEDIFYELGDQLNFDMSRHSGFCYGIACMTMQATLTNELPALKARLNTIDSLTKEEIDSLLRKHRATEHEPYTEKEIDILAFYEGISIYQNVGRRHSNLFEKYDWAEVGTAAALIAPINLQDRYLNWKAQQNNLTDEELTGPIAKALSLTAIFTKNEFINWLSLLADHLRNASVKYPLSICLNNYEHTIQLNFDIENNKWFYTSGFEIYESSDETSLANIVFNNKCFAKDELIDNFVEQEKLVLTTEFFVPTRQLIIARTHLNDWYMSNAVADIYNQNDSEIENEQPVNLTELFYLAISSANVVQLNTLVTSKIFLKKQTLVDTYGDPFIIAAHTSCNPIIMIELLKSDFDPATLVLSEHPAAIRALDLLQKTVVKNLLVQLRQIDINQLCEDNSIRVKMLRSLRDVGMIHQNQQLAGFANKVFELLKELENKEIPKEAVTTKLKALTAVAELVNLPVEHAITRLSSELSKLNERLDLTQPENKKFSATLIDVVTTLRNMLDRIPNMATKLNPAFCNQLINFIQAVSIYHSPEKQKTDQLMQQAMQTHALFQRYIPRDTRTVQPPRSTR